MEIARKEQESMLNKILEEARRARTMPPRNTQTKPIINNIVPKIIEAEVNTSIDVQNDLKGNATKSIVEIELSTQSTVIEKKIVNVDTLVTTTSFIKDTLPFDDSATKSNVQKNIENNNNLKETKNIFVAVKVFFVGIFGIFFHKK